MRVQSNPHLPPDYPMEPMEMATWAPERENGSRFSREWWRSLAIAVVCAGASIGVLVTLLTGGQS